MVKTFENILNDLINNEGWVAIAICMLAFGESLAVLGAVIPATPILLLIGTLLGQGILHPAEVVPGALGGAICGYWLSWAAGRRLRNRVYRNHWLAARRRPVARLRLFLRRWGGPSLVLGRFVLGPLQSTLPLVAGTMGMAPRRFHLWNCLSGILWVPIVLAPGYLAGRGLVPLGVSQDVMSGITIALAAVSIVAIIGMLAGFARQPRPIANN